MASGGDRATRVSLGLGRRDGRLGSQALTVAPCFFLFGLQSERYDEMVT